MNNDILPNKDMTHSIKINYGIIIPDKLWHHHDQVETWYHFSIYRLWSHRFLMTSTLGYSDVTCSLPSKNKLWHYPILMRCMTSFALMYSPAWKRSNRFLTGALLTTVLLVKPIFLLTFSLPSCPWIFSCETRGSDAIWCSFEVSITWTLMLDGKENGCLSL